MPTTEDKQLHITKLAKRIWQNFKPNTDSESKQRGYYMFNVNNSVVRQLANRYKTTKGIPLHQPMSDLDRVEFELLLLNNPTLKLIEDECAKAEQGGDKK